MESRTTAKYQVIQDAGGWRFRFYCDASGALGCATEVYRGERPEDALATAWESEGRRQFNRCGRCGRWVINAMYNVDSLQCVDCAPWTTRSAPPAARTCGERGERRMHEAVLQEDDRARLGFGETCMKQLRVCPECGQLAAPGEPRCRGCHAPLPDRTLYELYLSRHTVCPGCRTVARPGARYCHVCGRRLPADKPNPTTEKGENTT